MNTNITSFQNEMISEEEKNVIKNNSIYKLINNIIKNYDDNIHSILLKETCKDMSKNTQISCVNVDIGLEIDDYSIIDKEEFIKHCMGDFAIDDHCISTTLRPMEIVNKGISKYTKPHHKLFIYKYKKFNNDDDYPYGLLDKKDLMKFINPSDLNYLALRLYMLYK